MNGGVLYEGASQFNGEPIFCIITGLARPSANSKTGPMAQVWVLPQELPTQAIKDEKDESVCGACPLRHKICYVRLMTLNQIYTAYIQGKYARDTSLALSLIKLHRLKVRLTAYGEAPAVPFEVLEPFLSFPYTGYTHAWNNPKLDPRWIGRLQASVHSLPEAQRAQAQGWSTFRITLPGEEPAENETLCTHVESGITCSNCMKCNGSRNITDPVHGLAHKIKQFESLRLIE